ncbi:peptidase inhibitor family I36 protein [Kribbella deserti]|uniref:Peptidase inhibitor family I36 protein n=1 Tax=Kribbella deserti TaxID=1926257 RepID=A0ABV6QNZ3_9ACTN
MEFPKKSLLAILGVFAMMFAVSAPAQASTSPELAAAPTVVDMGQVAEGAGLAWDERKQELVAAWTCSIGEICFFSGTDGTGRVCSWTGADDDWLAGTVTCPWARTDSAESVRNNITNTAFTGIRYYISTAYRNTVGCIPRGARGNLQTSRLLRSHNWESGTCGIGPA